MPNLSKRELLPLLEKKTLLGLATEHELPVRANASHAVLVDALSAKRLITLEVILPWLSLPELRAACDHLGLARNGNKPDLLKRLQPAQAPAPKTLPKITKPATKRANNPMFEQAFKNILWLICAGNTNCWICSRTKTKLMHP